MDSISRIIRLARAQGFADRRCLLSRSTVLDVSGPGQGSVPFHIVQFGACVLEVGERRIPLRTGDVVLLPGGAPHRIATAGEGAEMLRVATSVGGAFETVRSGNGDIDLDLLLGHYRFGAGAGGMLLTSLPDPLHIPFGQSGKADELVRMISSMMRREARLNGPGSSVILSSLSEALLAMVLRNTGTRITEGVLWTAASDGRIRTVVDAVLREPGSDWSITRMASTAAMSRATFIRHFCAGTGMTVGEFLTRVRLMVAADLLAESRLTVNSIAGQVGYRSTSAFSRAFRSATGATPAHFRRTIRTDSG
ncbi:MAG TPA: AraC family transcriptional regulator [Pseudonocardia sp.]|nr:AraC family transcriptional regulator [Pseudonocardia sp.]